jgi:hypothetical protein
MAAKYFIVQGYEVDPNQLPHPDQGLPGPQPGWPRPPTGPVDPGYSPPWATPRPPQPGWPTVPGWPGGSLPGGAGGWPHPDNTLPGSQPRPDHGLPPFPSHPIYIPITPPPESGLEPTHPIYIPVYPDQGLPGPQPSPGWPTVPGWPGGSLPGGAGGFPHPDNTLPGPQPGRPPITPEQIQKLKAFVGFLFGNLPPGPETPPTPTPVA